MARARAAPPHPRRGTCLAIRSWSVLDWIEVDAGHADRVQRGRCADQDGEMERASGVSHRRARRHRHRCGSWLPPLVSTRWSGRRDRAAAAAAALIDVSSVLQPQLWPLPGRVASWSACCASASIRSWAASRAIVMSLGLARHGRRAGSCRSAERACSAASLASMAVADTGLATSGAALGGPGGRRPDGSEPEQQRADGDGRWSGCGGSVATATLIDSVTSGRDVVNVGRRWRDAQ